MLSRLFQVINKYRLNIIHSLNKNLSGRQIRLVVCDLILSKIPYIRRKYSCYTKTISAGSVSKVLPLSVSSKELFCLSRHEYDYYINHGYGESELTKDGRLFLSMDEDIFQLESCEILTKFGVILHVATEKIVTCTKRKLERRELKPFHYQKTVNLKGLVISLLNAEDYFHFMFDVTVPLFRILKLLPEARKATLLISDDFSIYQRSVLDIVLDEYPGLSIISVKRDVRVHCENLVVYCNKRNKYVDFMIYGDVLRLIRKKVHQWANAADNKVSKRIYISRNRYKYRKLLNEDEVIDALKPLGFEIVYPEMLPFIEQVSLFASAKIVIGTTGSALTNLLFCQPGSVFIETRPKDAYSPLYIGLSRQMGMKHYFMPGGMAGVYRAFSIDVDELIVMTKNLLKIK